MKISTKCPNCGKALKVNEELIGQIGACPACQAPFVVPANPKSPKPQVRGDQPPPSNPVSDTRNNEPNRSTKTQSRTTITQIIIGVALLAFWNGARLQQLIIGVPRSPNNSTTAQPVTNAEPPHWKLLSSLDPLIGLDTQNAFTDDYVLHWCYAHMRFDKSESIDWTSLQSRAILEGFRPRVSFYVEHLRSRSDLADFQKLFNNLDETLTAISQFLTEADQIRGTVKVVASQQTADAALKSGFAGLGVGLQVHNQGYSKNDAAGAAIAYGLVSFLLSEYQSNQALEESKRGAFRELAGRAERRFGLLRAQEQVLLGRIRSKFSFEVGREGKQVDRFTKEFERAHDAFANSATPEAGVKAARDILQLRQRIPSDPIHDSLRRMAYFYSGRLLSWVASQENPNAPWGQKSSRSAEYAVKILDLASRFDSVGFSIGVGLFDFEGISNHEIQAHRAWSLALCGQYADALREMRPWIYTESDCSGYAGLYVRIRSLAGLADQETLNWLQRAVSESNRHASFIGILSGGDVAKDPSLANLRSQQRAAVNQILTPKTNWKWTKGFISDELFLTNNSPFSLSKVELTVTFHGANPPVIRRFQAAIVLPGQTVEWKNQTIAVPRWTPQDTGSVMCDQSNWLVRQ